MWHGEIQIDLQLISIKIEKTGGLDWTDYRMIDGMYKNKLFHRSRGQSVEMSADDTREAAQYWGDYI